MIPMWLPPSGALNLVIFFVFVFIIFLDGVAVKLATRSHPSAFPTYVIRNLTLRTKHILSTFRLRWKVTSLVDFEQSYYSTANQ